MNEPRDHHKITLEEAEDTKLALHHTRPGDTDEHTSWTSDRVRVWSGVLAFPYFIVSFWAFFIPDLYYYAISALIMLPLLSLGLMHHFNRESGLNGGSSPLKAFYYALLLPCVVLTIRASHDFNILSWDGFWIPFAAFSLPFYVLTLFVTRKVRQRPAAAVALLLLSALLGYSAVICLNGILDVSTPFVYAAKVTGKRLYTGKYLGGHWLNLTPWGPLNEKNAVRVAGFIYHEHEVGDTVSVVVRDGGLGIPWVYVEPWSPEVGIRWSSPIR